MTLPGAKCRVRPRSEWTESEKWAWKKICKGKAADFNERSDARALNPRDTSSDDDWADRKLSSDFIETILLHEPFQRVIPRQGVRINGAYFSEMSQSTGGQYSLDLSDASIKCLLRLSMSRFECQVDISRVKTPTSIVLDGSRFDSAVDIESALIGGHISMLGSKFNGKLNMASVSIGQSLQMGEQAEFDEVVLFGAKVGGQISMTGSKFEGKLSMGAVSIGRSLLMGKQAEFDEVMLLRAKVGGQISMMTSKFEGKLNMNSVSIGQNLLMRTAELKVPARLVFITVASNLDASGAALSGMDLSGAQVKGELLLVDTQWKCYADEKGNLINPKLTLRNTSVGALLDSEETWPPCLRREFQGFTYERLGGLETTEDTSHYNRGIKWFRGWLARDTPYSPQPYRHLAATLRAAGHEGMADAILVANRDRERRSAKWWQPKKWALCLFKIVVGYGYGWRNFLAIVWAIVLVALGTGVLQLSGEQRFDVDGWSRSIVYSVDMLVPAIHLREEHYSVNKDLTTWAQYYFYVHKIMGYVLIFFVIAGLSGITDRQGRR